MYIAIDLGGTNVRIAGSQNLETNLLDKVEKFELSHDFENDFVKIVKTIKNIAVENVEAIGIGTPGTYNEDKSLLISARNILEWVDVLFVERLKKEFNCPVFADNDAVVASLGEAYKQKNNFVYVTWGTGVGGALVKWNDGKVFSEKLDGHIYLKKFENCGGKEIPKRFNKSAITEINEDEWTQVMNNFIIYLAELSENLNEKNIILGGGATSKQKERLQEVVSALEKKEINLILSSLNDEVGLYGAMALIRINK